MTKKPKKQSIINLKDNEKERETIELNDDLSNEEAVSNANEEIDYDNDVLRQLKKLIYFLILFCFSFTRLTYKPTLTFKTEFCILTWNQFSTQTTLLT